MDSNSEDGEYHNLEQQDAGQYRVTYSNGRNTKEVSWLTHSNRQMRPAGHALLLTKMCLCTQAGCDQSEEFNMKR